MSSSYGITGDDEEIGNRVSYTSPVYITIMSSVTAVTNICLGMSTMCAAMFINSYPLSPSMRQHVCLCVIGYVILMAQAVQSMNQHSGWARVVRYQDRRVIHWLLQIIGSILIIVGSIIRMNAVRNNFQTAHGVLGLIAFVLTVCNMICGLAGAYARKLKINPLSLRLVHSFLGCLTLCAGFLCLCIAYNTTLRSLMGDTNADIAIILTIVGLTGTILSPCIDMILKVMAYFKK